MQDHTPLVLTDSGELVPQPLTWDREPLYSASTEREGLFDSAAFKQYAGQRSFEDERD